MKEIVMKLLKIVILMFFLTTLFIPVTTVFASPAQDQLKSTIDNILVILRDPSFQEDEQEEKRRKALSKIIHERFSFAKMSQLSLARHWKKRSDKEKRAFIKMFGQLLEDIYVSKIETYTNEKVVYVKEFVRGKKAQVSTKIVTDSIEIPIDYRMFKIKNGQWLVYDLVIETASLVSNYRLQFDQILQKESYEKLVENFNKKLDQ
jgi:phospholipid transport system substrate-binding protein